ncbi:hypothetical protein [Kribbella monticola]|uniref:hypothetical protein n=1 Tax=Kribbella monticola TaxID=2185285 RepID=UPI000DD3CC1B|nr:hypothetical protein [Kribbella monticola]
MLISPAGASAVSECPSGARNRGSWCAANDSRNEPGDAIGAKSATDRCNGGNPRHASPPEAPSTNPLPLPSATEVTDDTDGIASAADPAPLAPMPDDTDGIGRSA